MSKSILSNKEEKNIYHKILLMMPDTLANIMAEYYLPITRPEVMYLLAIGALLESNMAIAKLSRGQLLDSIENISDSSGNAYMQKHLVELSKECAGIIENYKGRSREKLRAHDIYPQDEPQILEISGYPSYQHKLQKMQEYIQEKLDNPHYKTITTIADLVKPFNKKDLANMLGRSIIEMINESLHDIEFRKNTIKTWGDNGEHLDDGLLELIERCDVNINDDSRSGNMLLDFDVKIGGLNVYDAMLAIGKYVSECFNECDKSKDFRPLTAKFDLIEQYNTEFSVSSSSVRSPDVLGCMIELIDDTVF